MGYLPRRAVCGDLNYPESKIYLEGSKVERTEPYNPSTMDVGLQHVELSLLGFGLGLVQYFLTMPDSSLLRCIFYDIVC